METIVKMEKTMKFKKKPIENTVDEVKIELIL